MLHHGCVPENLLLCTVIPIPKSTRKSMYSSNNYRGIALSSVLGKVLDKIIFNKSSSVLVTSELQYGFKPDHSTTKCTLFVKATIQYYLDKDTSTDAMLLDASKAFDKVEYLILFQLLLEKGLC